MNQDAVPLVLPFSSRNFVPACHIHQIYNIESHWFIRNNVVYIETDYIRLEAKPIKGDTWLYQLIPQSYLKCAANMKVLLCKTSGVCEINTDLCFITHQLNQTRSAGSCFPVHRARRPAVALIFRSLALSLFPLFFLFLSSFLTLTTRRACIFIPYD